MLATCLLGQTLFWKGVPHQIKLTATHLHMDQLEEEILIKEVAETVQVQLQHTHLFLVWEKQIQRLFHRTLRQMLQDGMEDLILNQEVEDY